MRNKRNLHKTSPARNAILTGRTDPLTSGERWPDDRISSFTGATPLVRREDLKRRFNADPAKDPLRILICTDAAREGINLQTRCHDLIHLDLPWNPARLEASLGQGGLQAAWRGESASGRFCCKSLFALVIKNSPGRRRDFRVRMWGTSSPDEKLTRDLARVIEAISIDGRGSDCLTAGKLAPGNLGLLQQYLP
jgi:hypothetical protein